MTTKSPSASPTKAPAKSAAKPTPTRPGAGAPAGSTSRRAVAITVGLLVAAGVIALIVALAAGGDDGSDNAASSTARIPSGELRQVSFAETDGAALPRFDAAVAIDPAVGLPAPSITAQYFDNEEVTIDPADGTPRIVIFLAHWCPHCQAEVIELTEWFETNGVPTDVEIVAISTGVDQGNANYPPSSWLIRELWPIPVLRDSAQGDLASGYGLSGFPFMVVIGADGEVLSRSSGQLPLGAWEAKLSQAVNG